MRYALVNPNWSFEGSIYFGCREPHLPLELGYAKALLERRGHAAEIIDGHMFGLPAERIRERLIGFRPDVTVVTTAPTYLFWRCAQPELGVPQRLLEAVGDIAGVTVAVGPHGSTTPRAALRKLGVDYVVMGECEETLVRLADGEPPEGVPGLCYADDGEIRVQGGPQAVDFAAMPALSWPDEVVHRHRHHHHRFDPSEGGPGAEVEASRGCPYRCSFCAKENFRNGYRRRALEAVIEEIDGFRRQGVEYLYFVDEIFLANRALVEALIGRGLRFGIQTRIDLWKPEMIDLLAEAGCVSIEAGVESLSVEGRAALDKNCRMSTEELTERLIYARRRIPFVQANLIAVADDDADEVQAWRERMRGHGVWANDPVPLYPYPGSPDYRKLWGLPDDDAWERAHEYYLRQFEAFSDIQDQRPLPLDHLERRPVT